MLLRFVIYDGIGTLKVQWLFGQLVEKRKQFEDAWEILMSILFIYLFFYLLID